MSYDPEVNSKQVLFNKGKLVNDDVNSFVMRDMIYDSIGENINDLGYNKPHYFYCYENLNAHEDLSTRFTRLVIQADLLGNTYYYSININQEKYGHSIINGHYGIKRNTLYKLNVTIKRPGSTNPDEPMEMGSMDCTLKRLNWNNTIVAQPEF